MESIEGQRGEQARQKRKPRELRERAVRMVLVAIEENGGERVGVIPRGGPPASGGVESLRGWVKQAEIDVGGRPGVSTVRIVAATRIWSVRTASCVEPTRFSRQPRLSFARELDPRLPK